MSERIVNDPSQHGWVEENGKWVWDGSGGSIQDGDTEGQITTWSGTEWTPEGAVVVDANGNVGIGTDNPSGMGPLSKLYVKGAVVFDEVVSASEASLPAIQQGSHNGTGQDLMIAARSSNGALRFFTGNTGSDGSIGDSSNVERMRIDSSGRVGIGGEPSRSTKEIEEDAEATLANWKSQLDERLKAEPKADKKAVTQEITGHEKMPTKAALIKELTERTIGGGDAKLQVNGTIFTSTSGQASSIGGIKIGENGTNVESTIGVLALKSLTNEHISFYPGGNYLGVWYPDGTLAVNWGNKLPIPEAGTAKLQVNGDGYFSGNVGINGVSSGEKLLVHENTASSYDVNAMQNSAVTLFVNSANALSSGSTILLRQFNGTSAISGLYTGTNDGALAFGTSSAASGGNVVERMRIDANGRVDINGSLYVNGSEVGSGGAYVPLTGNSTVNGTITATDFIATSDERLKEDISPLPVGLIDDIKPVQWNWKDGSGKSAGVIAQQLQAIGLDDFVNEDADGNLGVNYNALVGVLLAEVISLKAEVESLK